MQEGVLGHRRQQFWERPNRAIMRGLLCVFVRIALVLPL